MTKIISIILIITFTLTTEIIIPPFIKGGAGGISIAFASDKITPYPPETKQTPAIEEVKAEKGGVSWLWIILGVVAVGGIAAAAGGGGGSSGGSSGGVTAGTVTVSY